MRKFIASILILLCASSASADTAFGQQQDLGRDRAGLQWYLVGYGPTATGYFAVAREYFTNTGVKAELVNKLVQYHGVPQDRANAIYFTEYTFEYTSDGAMYAETSRVFYDMLGNEVCGYRTGHVIYNPIIANTVQSKGVYYAMGVLR